MMKDLSVRDVVVISGIRPAGRSVVKDGGRSRHGLLYLWNGEAAFTLKNNKTVTVTGGQLAYLPKGLEYKMQYTAKSTTFVLLNFGLAEQGDVFLAAADTVTLLVKQDDAHTVANIMAKLELCGAAQNTAGMLRRKELFYRLLSFVYGRCDLDSENTSYAPIVKGVLLLKQTYLENLPIETFAEQSNVSISLFRRLFHQQYGMSPLQYRNLLRINRAKQLLEYDYSTVAEVAYACGFENVGYFCRYYKRITGETPTQTRQK